MKKFSAQVVLAFLLLFAQSPTSSYANKARLTDIAVTTGRDHCLVFFRVTDCFTGEMKDAIENGIRTTFTFWVKFYEVRDLWWDKKIADIKISHEIQYDGLKKVYRIKLSEKENKVIIVEDFEEAKKWMSEVKGLAVTELDDLHKGTLYRVRMMAQLDKIRLPFYLHYVLFFLSLWDFETDWYTQDYRY